MTLRTEFLYENFMCAGFILQGKLPTMISIDSTTVGTNVCPYALIYFYVYRQSKDYNKIFSTSDHSVTYTAPVVVLCRAYGYTESSLE